jgi:hypothetical protein
VRDPDKYGTVEVNKMLTRVMRGQVVVGQVRKGMDNLWYAEVGDGQRSRVAAVQLVVLANQAIVEFQECAGGNG